MHGRADDQLAKRGRYYVHLRKDVRDSCRPVEGAASFEEAAILYVETWAPEAGSDGEVAVIVVDPATGERQCFTLDLGSGEAEPCG